MKICYLMNIIILIMLLISFYFSRYENSKLQIIPDIISLKNYRNILNNKVIYLSGGKYSGDGFAGYFQWEDTSTENENWATIISSNKIKYGRWKRISCNVINADWFSVFKFGIKDNNVQFSKLSSYVNSLKNNLGYEIPIFFPAGHYLYSGGLNFTRPVSIYSDSTCVFDYIGSGNAIYFGPNNINVKTFYNYKSYSITGITFRGGETMKNGIVFDNFITSPKITRCVFDDFGNKKSYAIFSVCNNWDIYVDSCSWYTSPNFKGSNWIKINGYSNSGVSDNGNSRLRLSECLATNLCPYGVGVILSGANSEISNSKIEGFSPNVYFGKGSNFSRISGCYFEVTRKGSCFEIGLEENKNIFPAINYFDGISIDGNYVNTHNLDIIKADAYFLSVAEDSPYIGVKNIFISNNHITSYSKNRQLINLNKIPFQIGNIVIYNTGADKISEVLENNVLNRIDFNSSN